MSCKCQACGDYYYNDIIVSDDLWEKIKPENKPIGAGLLCGKCIINRITTITNETFHLISDKNCDNLITKTLITFHRIGFKIEKKEKKQ